MSDLNDRIAIAKGWRKTAYDDNRFHAQPCYWVDAANVVRGEECPDFTGTLEGVAGMMRELNERNDILIEDKWRTHWMLYFEENYSPEAGAWVCTLTCALAIDSMWALPVFFSPPDRPGDCVGEAWMSVFGKEAADASTTN